VRAGNKVTIRGGPALVLYTYEERGRLVSVTVRFANDRNLFRYVVYPRDEGVEWVRGWKTAAAKAFRSALALEGR